MDTFYLYEMACRLMFEEQMRQQSQQGRELLAYQIFRLSVADYKAIAEAATPGFLEGVEPETQVYHWILASQAAYDITQTEGLVVPVLQHLGDGEPFAASALVQFFNDDDTPVSPKEVLMLMINPDSQSMSMNTEALTMPDGQSFIRALSDAGRIIQLAKPDALMSRAEYIQLRNTLESGQD
jgi:hypothetical protein